LQVSGFCGEKGRSKSSLPTTQTFIPKNNWVLGLGIYTLTKTQTQNPDDTWTKQVKEEVLKLLAVEKERSKVMEEERKERQENRKTTIDPNCPKYSGRFDENVEVWIFRVRHAMAMQKVPTKEQLSALLSYTDGAAT